MDQSTQTVSESVLDERRIVELKFGELLLKHYRALANGTPEQHRQAVKWVGTQFVSDGNRLHYCPETGEEAFKKISFTTEGLAYDDRLNMLFDIHRRPMSDLVTKCMNGVSTRVSDFWPTMITVKRSLEYWHRPVS